MPAVTPPLVNNDAPARGTTSESTESCGGHHSASAIEAAVPFANNDVLRSAVAYKGDWLLQYVRRRVDAQCGREFEYVLSARLCDVVY